MLGKDEGLVEVDRKDIGVNPEELVLHLVVDLLHPVVVVEVQLVLHVEENQRNQDEEQNKGHVEGEESDERPNFEENDEFELDGETGVLYLLVQYLLAPHRPIFVLNCLPPPVPAAVHQVHAREDDLHDDESDCLVAEEGQDGTPVVCVEGEVDGGDKKVEDEVEEDSRDDDEHGPPGVGVGKPHFRQLIHPASEGESDYHDE